MTSAATAHTASDAVVAESVGDALLLRTAHEDGQALARLVAGLPTEPDRVVVVSSPAVTGLPDLFELLHGILSEELGGCADGVRLVPLGRYADSALVERAAGRLASWIGRDVAVPLWPLSEADVAGAARGGDRVWLACAEGSPPRIDRAWPPGPPQPAPAVVLPDGLPQPMVPAEPEPAGTASVGGWSFVDGSAVVDVVLATGFVVEVGLTATGFRMAGRPVPPAVMADMIAAVRGETGGPVVVVHHGTAPTGPAADLLFGGLADALGSPVIAADATVSPTPDGGLSTTGAFHRWTARSSTPDDAGRHQLLGATLHDTPPALVEAPPTEPPPSADPRVELRAQPPKPVAVPAEMAAVLDAARWPGPPLREPRDAGVDDPAAEPHLDPDEPTAQAPEARPVVATGQPSLPAAAPSEVPGLSMPVRQAPLWISSAEWEMPDRTRLRHVLNGRYDAYARVIGRTLAEQPGMRSAEATADLVAGLVAVSAYQDGDRDGINRTLRTGGVLRAPDEDRARTFARGVAYGLQRLPTVLGRVHATSRAALSVVDHYRVGDEIIEPAFLDVDTVPTRSPDGSVEFVIWSASARRLDRAGAGDLHGALFPAGTRFAVLAVDGDDGAAGPVRILLQDQTGSGGARQPGGRLLERLRAATPHDQRQPPARLLDFAPGFDAQGRRFTPPPGNLALANRGPSTYHGGARA
ncbi:hypothetical protein ABZS66_11450 [Dactylosporangium sp. NPDC005572]|uniref:hypothetical protein n=1 Tax=Dactylosporangium sp. NPDC005572 TaxID=3156889 RepID=UPI0033BB0A71